MHMISRFFFKKSRAKLYKIMPPGQGQSREVGQFSEKRFTIRGGNAIMKRILLKRWGTLRGARTVDRKAG